MTVERGSIEWLDLCIVGMLDRAWNRRGKYLSAYEIQAYFAPGKVMTVSLEAINSRLVLLIAQGEIEAMIGRDTVLRYSRIRPRLRAGVP